MDVLHALVYSEPLHFIGIWCETSEPQRAAHQLRQLIVSIAGHKASHEVPPTLDRHLGAALDHLPPQHLELLHTMALHSPEGAGVVNVHDANMAVY